MADTAPFSSPFVPCGRPGHPGPYIHQCFPQCESASPRSGERCHKDAGHEDFHWVLREGDMEVWGGSLVTPSRTDRQPPNPVAGANSGLSAVGPDDTKRPDLVTHHEPSAEDTE